MTGARVALLSGPVTTVISLRVHPRERTRCFCDATIGFAFITVGVVIGGSRTDSLPSRSPESVSPNLPRWPALAVLIRSFLR